MKSCELCDKPAGRGKLCETHAEKRRASVRRTVDRWVAAGLCRQCGGSKDRDGKLCMRCASKHSAREGGHGATLEDRLRLFNDQGGLCAVCADPLSGPCAAAVDHDHKSGKVRGMLCRGCNLGLGYFKDDEKRLTSAVVYLSRSR